MGCPCAAPAPSARISGIILRDADEAGTDSHGCFSSPRIPLPREQPQQEEEKEEEKEEEEEAEAQCSSACPVVLHVLRVSHGAQFGSSSSSFCRNDRLSS